MGQRGPNRPGHLKVISGTSRPSRPEDLPPVPGDQALTEVPDPPSYLKSETAREEWYRVARILIERGWLDELRLTALATYCASHAQMVQRLEAGVAITTDLMKTLNKMQRDLGMTGPVPGQPKGGGDPAKKPSRWADLKRRAQENDD